MIAQPAKAPSGDGRDGRDPRSPLEPLVRDAVQQAGFELEDLEVVRAGRRQLVRVIVDTPDAAAAPAEGDTEGITLDGIATVSRVVADELDANEHLVAGSYTLEVTSPGVDRPLTRPRHWRRNRLRRVRARFHDGGELVGRVGDCEGDAVVLLVDGELRRIEFAELERAVVEVEFREPPAAELAALGVSEVEER